MNKSSSKLNPQSPFRIILGLVASAAAGLALIVVFVATGSPTPAPTPTTRPPATTTATPLIKPPTPTPGPQPDVPDVAPDFTLDRAGGGSFTLNQQLEEGPVVLVFFERCG